MSKRSCSITYVFYDIAEMARKGDVVEARRQYQKAVDDVKLWATASDLGCFQALSVAADKAAEACYG
jgi:hypothetical protein